MRDCYAETYPWDIVVYHRLGLRPFKMKTAKDRDKGRYLGTIKNGVISIRVYVFPMSAQFFEFRVKRKKTKYRKGQNFKIKTGSGSMADYESVLERFKNDMCVIENFKETK